MRFASVPDRPSPLGASALDATMTPATPPINRLPFDLFQVVFRICVKTTEGAKFPHTASHVGRV